MLLPGTHSSAAAPAASDAIQRPDPGLARGRWESPAWLFWLVAAAALLGGVAWLAIAVRARKAPR